MSSDTTHHHQRLSYEETQLGLQRVVREGIASQTMESLTKGVFLVGLALQLGASNFVIGLLGAVPFLSNLFQILAVLLIERYRDRRKIVTISCFIGRSFLLLVAAAPFLPNPHLALVVVIFAIAMRYCVGALAGCAWNSWMRDLVPKVIMGQFFGRRMFVTTSMAAMLGLGAGFFLDWWRQEFPQVSVLGYSGLYVLGFVAGMISTLVITTIPHPKMRAPEADDYKRHVTLRHFKEPLQNENFRKLMMFLMTWNFAANLATPFFAVYMLKALHYDMLFVVAITLMSQLVNAFSLRVWGKYIDLYSNKNVLAICGTLFLACIFGWTFTTMPEKHAYTTHMLVILHILMGIGMSGVSLTTANIAMKLTPSHKATAFLAMNTVLTSIAAGIAPLVGGVVADYFENTSLSLEFHWHDLSGDSYLSTLVLDHWDFCFLLSTIIGLYSLRRLALVEEHGAVKEKIVIREIMMDTGRVLRSISTVDGLRDLTMTPMAMMVNLIKRKHGGTHHPHH